MPRRTWPRAAARGTIYRSAMRTHAAIAVFALLAAGLGGCAVERLWEPSREQILERILPSTVQIVLEQAEGRRVRTASGVVVASRPREQQTDCFVLTAGHTVNGLVGQSQAFVVFGAHRNQLVKAPASVIAFRDNTDVDLALLRTQAEQCSPARVGSTALLGEPVWVVGFPWGRHMTLTRGIVSQVAMSDGADRETASRLMVDAAVSYGSSGGGVFGARDGTLLGLIEGYSTARVASKGATPSWYIEVPVPGQTFVTPLTDVRRFLAQTSYPDLLSTSTAGLAER